MEAGILGLPNVGKSTLFNALTAAGAESANYPFCTIEPNVGVVEVPDPRLERIHAHIPAPKVVPSALRLVDIAGLVKGASEGEGLGNQFLSHVREVDANVHVVRCFSDDNVAHVDGDVDPVRDAGTIETELMLADLQTVESALDKARRVARSGDKDARARVETLALYKAELEAGRPVRGLVADVAELALAKELGLLTAKPLLYVANVDETDLAGERESVQRLRAHAEAHNAGVVPVCARLEAELVQLAGEERAQLLSEMGLSEPALHVLARSAYRLLGLQSFFTAGTEKEVRAWAVRAGATAPEAAGVIHSDMQRGFIRAEVYRLEDLEACGSEKAIRDAGRMRSEGKDYVIQDGDICRFLFNT
jgi:GTP-binding protein YchF